MATPPNLVVVDGGVTLGVHAHAVHRPESNLQPNRRFIKNLMRIGYEFDSRFLSILLRLQAFPDGIRVMVGRVRQQESGRLTMRVGQWQE
jgi:hypothetical protein